MPRKTNTTKPADTDAFSFPEGFDVAAFVIHVRENDLLLRGRDMAEAPEGAGSWKYLLADALAVEPKAVTAPMVAAVKMADTLARNVGKPKPATKRRTTRAKAATVAKAAAPAPAPDALADVMAKIDALTEVVGTMASVVFDVEA